MRKRKLGNTNIELTQIGLGTFAMGGSNWQYSWGYQDEKDSITTIKNAIELGVNWIDTAPAYGLGRAEEIVGKAVQGLRDKIYISTKCGFIWDADRSLSNDLTGQSIRREVEASLSRLKTEVIDLYQIHWPLADHGDMEEAWRTINELIKEGKLRYAGVSNFSPDQIKTVHNIASVSFIQPPYSMINRAVERELLPFCDQNNIGVIVYSPLQKGLLTGAFSKKRVNNLTADDHRKTSDVYFKEPRLSHVLKLVNELKVFAHNNNISLSQLALAWVLTNKTVTSAIVGARNPAQIEENIKAADIDIPTTDLKQIESLLAEYNKYMT